WYSDDQLFLITDGTWHLVNVFDIQGRSLLTKAIMGESFVALPFRFAPGLYVLQLSSGHMVKPVKLLVR
ncbi:MAG: T9SS type A sorting domain-containing protein, partial [Bacteroidales bacterium]